jgi:hypothetical protein
MQDEALQLLTDKERRQVETGKLPAVGFVEDFTTWASRKTDAPQYTMRAAGLMALSLAAGDGVVLPGLFSDDAVHMNLYVLIIGQSTVLRKTTVLNYVDGLLPMSQTGKLVTTLDDVSPQALNRALGTAGGSRQPVLMSMDEVAGVFEVQKRHGSYLAGLDKVLMKSYDHSPIYVLRANTTLDVPTGAFVNVFAASTPEPLEKVLEGADVESGLLPRFLLFDATGAQRGHRRSLMDRSTDDWAADKEALQDHLKGIAAPTITMQPEPVVLGVSEEAIKRLDALDAIIYKEAGQDATAYGAMKGRAFWHAFKLAGLYAMSRDGREATVELHDVLRALHTVEACLHDLAGMQERVRDNSFERLANEVMTYLVMHGGSATIAEVTKALKLDWRQAADLQRTLEMRGDLTVDAQTKTWRQK